MENCMKKLFLSSVALLLLALPQVAFGDEKKEELTEQRKKEIKFEKEIEDNKQMFKAQMEEERKKFEEMMKEASESK